MLPESVRERFGSADRRRLAATVAAGALIAGAALVWYLRSMPAPVRIEALPAGPAPAASATARPPSPAPSPVVVDVAGMVVRPGVYELAQGDRVIDAIRRAGGPRRGADLTSINLAALLVDAEQILVPRRGSAGGVSAAGGVAPGAAPPGAGPGGAVPGAKVSLNAATLEQLDSLPGIGPVLAQRILDYRQQHGPFRRVEDLLNVSGIGEARLADLKPLVTV